MEPSSERITATPLSRRYVAAPHPPVDFCWPAGTVVVTYAVGFAAMRASMGHGAGLVLAAILFAGLACRRIRRKVHENPGVDLHGASFFPVMGATAALVLIMLVGTMLVASPRRLGGEVVLGLATFYGALWLTSSLALRGAEGGAAPEGSSARRALALGPWRTCASSLVPLNLVTALYARLMGRSAPFVVCASLAAVVCALCQGGFLGAQMRALREEHAASREELGAALAWKDGLTKQGLRDLERRELVRGLVAVCASLATVAAQRWILAE